MGKAVQRATCTVHRWEPRQLSRVAASPRLHAARCTLHVAPPFCTRSGFTLIEMIVVLVGLAVVASAVVPQILAAGRQGDLDRIAVRVAASARFARETAIEHQSALLMTVEAAPDAVRLQWESEEMAPDAPDRARVTSERRDGQRGAASQEPTAGVSLPRLFAIVPLPSRVTAHLEPAPEEGVLSAPAVVRAPLAGGSGPSAPALRFPADGRTEGGVVVLADDRGRERRIVVTPESGVVRIEGENG
jgi:prepilin-type N-terminal cleavage/methylation domain-containing protein